MGAARIVQYLSETVGASVSLVLIASAKFPDLKPRHENAVGASYLEVPTILRISSAIDRGNPPWQWQLRSSPCLLRTASALTNTMMYPSAPQNRFSEHLAYNLDLQSSEDPQILHG